MKVNTLQPAFCGLRNTQGRRTQSLPARRQHSARPRIRLRVRVSAVADAAVSHQSNATPWSSAVQYLRELPRAALDWWRVDSPAKSAQPDGPVKLGPVVAKLWSLCAPDIPLLITASVFMVTASVCELAIPHYATKSIFAASEGKAFAGFLSILSCMVAMYGIAAALRGFCFSILNNRMTRRLRTELFTSLARRETAFFDGEDVGNLTSRLQADCQAMTKVIATNANIAVRNLLQAVGGIAYLFMLSPSLCGITVALSAVLWAVTLVYGSFARRMQKIFQDMLAESNTVAEEALSLSRVVRTFGAEDSETRRYTSWLDRLYEVGKRQAAGYAAFVATGHIACYASKVAALAVGCGMVLTGRLTAEQLTNFIMYVEFITYASLNVCDEFTEICEAVGASERVVTMLGAPPAPQISPGSTLPFFSGRISLRDVTFSYPSRPGVLALNGVSLTFRPGRLTALVGLSGSGKTTVCALLQRLYDPSGGCLLLDEQLELRAADAAWYRSQVGVVPQEPRLFGRSIAANIAYGMEHDPPNREAVEEAARAANAHDFIMALPQGYDTMVTDKLLSGGQRQRLALARALVRKPKVLVLDEFSSALDAESEAQVNAALDRAMSARDRTVVVIAHRLSTVRHADCIVVMDKGKVYEMGSHHKLLAQRGVYWQLVCRQQYGIDPNAAADTDSDSILAAANGSTAASGSPSALNGGLLVEGDGGLGPASSHSFTYVTAGTAAPYSNINLVSSAYSLGGSGDGGGGGFLSSSTRSIISGSSTAPFASTATEKEEEVVKGLLGGGGGGGLLCNNLDEPALDEAGGRSSVDADGAGGAAVRPPSAASAAASMGTIEDDNDEAGRPATAAAAGRLSAVLAGVVLEGPSPAAQPPLSQDQQD